MTDDHLVELLQTGHEEALGFLYDRYVKPIYRFFYWQANNRKEIAEDLTQETFVEMAKSIHTFKGVCSFKNWLYSIAKNRLSHWLRSQYDLPTQPLLDIFEQKQDFIDPGNQQKKIALLNSLLEKLTLLERQVLTRRYLRNFTVIETAQSLHLTPSNVKVIAHRSIKKLQKISLVTSQAL